MKATVFTFLATLFASIIFPLPILTAALGLAMFIDFITGLLAAIATRQEVASRGCRGSVIKLCQYGFAVIVCIIIGTISTANGYFENVKVVFFLSTIVGFMTAIECRSIIENLIRMAPTSKMSTFFLKPILSLFTAKLTNFFDKYQEKEEPKTVVVPTVTTITLPNPETITGSPVTPMTITTSNTTK